MPRYKIADIVFSVQLKYDYTKNLCKGYEYSGVEEDCFSASVSEQEIAEESKNMPGYPDGFLESLVVFRKLCEYALTDAQGIIFHCSAISVDGQAYLFTAPSGTGKSTHTRLWRELLKDRAEMINDDKPIIRYIDGDFYVYGTPWQGKHNLGTNTRAKIKAICQIYQSKTNVIVRLAPFKMLSVILNQTVRPTDSADMDKLLTLIDKMLSSVGLYSLGCDISLDAAKLSFETMSGGKV